jgi:antitoxin YobK
MYQDVVELIKRKRVAFPPFGSGVSEAAIDAAEAALGMAFSPSYRWWLRNYGGGQIGGDIIYGLDEARIEAPDIIELHKADLAEGLRPDHELVFDLGNEESFYFDTRHRLETGEYLIQYHEVGQPAAGYARSFDEFLRKRITELLGR